MTPRRLANVFGALTLAVADGIKQHAEDRLSRGGRTAAALVLIGHVPGLTIDALARGLGLSHPGTVRLVDRLVADGLVERRHVKEDGRAVGLHMAAAGRAQRRAILHEREERLAGLLANLSASEQVQLERISEKLLRLQVDGEADALRVCRFCDERACEPCPVDSALGAS